MKKARLIALILLIVFTIDTTIQNQSLKRKYSIALLGQSIERETVDELLDEVSSLINENRELKEELANKKK